MKVARLLALGRKAAPFSFLTRIVPFSSYSDAKPKSMNYTPNDDDKVSKPYGDVVKFRWSSASFTGFVEQPLQLLNTKNDRLGVWTWLRVRNSPEFNGTLRILLHMWDELAESSLRHLIPNHFIHVGGSLESYRNRNMNSKLYYKLTVKKLNYVTQHGQNFEESQSQEVKGETGYGNYEDRLHLWQVFFTNPHEWWDCRKNKRNPKQPDFKHKDTSEALWLNTDDPPWIKKQLELLDSQTEEKDQQERVRNRSFSEWL